MKLHLPHKSYDMDMSIPIEERKVVVDKILIDSIEFHDETMTVEEYFRYTWNKDYTKTLMDMIAYYLTKEEKELDVLSHKKQKEMEKGSKRHTTFSSLSIDNQVAIGITDMDDNDYN